MVFPRVKKLKARLLQMYNLLLDYKKTTSKLSEINWLLVVLIFGLGLVGVAMIFAATGGDWLSGARQHFYRMIFATFFMLFIAIIDLRLWYTISYPFYVVVLVLLISVDLMGVTVNGSKRWVDLQIVNYHLVRIQPSEIMKLAIVLALSRFYHDLPRWRVSSIYGLSGAFLIIFVPMFFIMRQPDLGTTLLVAATGLSIIFLAGINWRLLASFFIFSIISIPLFFIFGLQTYQRERILTFLDPTHDPSGASYHIIQSKIALGSGGFNGKGFMSGTQRQLEYVPENRTDFIFTVIGEEFGFVGSLSAIATYMVIIGICVWLSVQCKQVYSKLLILGFTITFALYVFINLAMIMGLAPVVGVPLPLISYGGTVLLTVMTGFGLILSAYINRDSKLPSSKFKN